MAELPSVIIFMQQSHDVEDDGGRGFSGDESVDDGDIYLHDYPGNENE